MSDEWWSEFANGLLGIIRAWLYEAIRAGFAEGNGYLSVAVDWNLVNESAREYANNYSYELVGGLTNTTKTQLQSAVAQWIDSGEPLSDLVSTLSPIFGADRAELIASTETTRAYFAGNSLSWLADGVEKYQWQTAQDEMVCPICGPRAGNEYALNGNIQPPAHPRCRCWGVPVL